MSIPRQDFPVWIEELDNSLSSIFEYGGYLLALLRAISLEAGNKYETAIATSGFPSAVGNSNKMWRTLRSRWQSKLSSISAIAGKDTAATEILVRYLRENLSYHGSLIESRWQYDLGIDSFKTLPPPDFTYRDLGSFVADVVEMFFLHALVFDLDQRHEDGSNVLGSLFAKTGNSLALRHALHMVPIIIGYEISVSNRASDNGRTNPLIIALSGWARANLSPRPAWRLGKALKDAGGDPNGTLLSEIPSAVELALHDRNDGEMPKKSFVSRVANYVLDVLPDVESQSMPFGNYRQLASDDVDSFLPLEEIIADAKSASALDRLVQTEEIEHAISQLTRRQREIAPLIADGLTYPQISDLLGNEVGTIKSQVSRMRHNTRPLE